MLEHRISEETKKGYFITFAKSGDAMRISVRHRDGTCKDAVVEHDQLEAVHLHIRKMCRC